MGICEYVKCYQSLRARCLGSKEKIAPAVRGNIVTRAKTHTEVKLKTHLESVRACEEGMGWQWVKPLGLPLIVLGEGSLNESVRDRNWSK